MDDIFYTEITHIEDDLLLPWLDLYETAFPPNEKILVSNHLETLKIKARGEAQDDIFLAALDSQGKLLGMARFQILPEVHAAILWYLAVTPRERSQGLGSKIYQEIIRRIGLVNVHALVMEVEIPELCHSEETRQFADRRIRFYHRHGARQLTGIHCLQHVGWHQPPTPMHILIHPLQRLEPQAAFDLAKCIFGDHLTQVGELSLE
jgi:GNAT superfamily N-acetyltransferase